MHKIFQKLSFLPSVMPPNIPQKLSEQIFMVPFPASLVLKQNSNFAAYSFVLVQKCKQTTLSGKIWYFECRIKLKASEKQEWWSLMTTQQNMKKKMTISSKIWHVTTCQATPDMIFSPISLYTEHVTHVTTVFSHVTWFLVQFPCILNTSHTSHHFF